ncbi:MAG: glucose-6-phosphate dehydrogenase [Rhodothermales bacterium]
MTTPDPHLIVLFGATGDLVSRMLMPGLFRVAERYGVLDHTYVMGIAREDHDAEAFQRLMRLALKHDRHDLGHDAVEAWTGRNLTYYGLGEDDQDYAGLKDRIEAFERKHHLSGNRLIYLSIPPKAYEVTIEGLGAQGLHDGPGTTQLVVEKPFGWSLETAQHLNKLVHRYFREEQVYRVDHFVGKETVQNVLAVRFANPLFSAAWDADAIDHVEINADESLTLEGRAEFYDATGALRDMVQNHLLQMLLFATMPSPKAFTAEALHAAKQDVLDAIRPIDPKTDVVFGQYSAGTIGDREVPAYLDENGIPDDSTTETFAAVRLYIDNDQWRGVPFILRTGKSLNQKCMEIAIHFKPAHASFLDPGEDPPNVLRLRLSPTPGIHLDFDVKQPGDDFTLSAQSLDFCFEDEFGALPHAYESLLYEALTGDRTLFIGAKEVEAAWALFQPVLDADVEVHPYASGSKGPDAMQWLYSDKTEA